MNKNNIQPQWHLIGKKPTWSHVSTQELAEVLGVPIQNINNWVLRETMPKPEGKIRHKGNRNWFRISSIRSWIENRSETDIHDEWIETHINGVQHMRTFKEIQSFVQKSWRNLEIDKPI